MFFIVKNYLIDLVIYSEFTFIRDSSTNHIQDSFLKRQKNNGNKLSNNNVVIVKIKKETTTQ